MNLIFVFIRLFSIVLAIIGTSFLLPIGTALFYGETKVVMQFVIPMLIAWIVGIIFYFAGKKTPIKLGTRAVFAFVSIAWIAISFYGAIPLYSGGYLQSLADAVFEAVSGFSTTGATIFKDVESLPRSINLWRMEMHWLGGMGIIALTTAILPLLGVGGFQLVKAESTGPEKGKITPKMANTAKALWLIYISFTLLQTFILMLVGMDFIDALGHAFSTLGTGGFSSKNSSISGFNSLAIEVVCTIFMFLAGVNFSLYFYILTKKINEVKKNSEFKAYTAIFTLTILCLSLCLVKFYGSFSVALRYASFQVASIMSTTGFATADFMTWPPAAQFFIFILFFIGGSSGSTAGGFKVIRWVILAKKSGTHIQGMLHPHGVFTVRINGAAGREDLVLNIAAFVFIYIVLTFLSTFVGTLTGLDLFQSFTATLSMIGNIGPAFGPFAEYSWIPTPLKWWYCFVMIAGRLELYNLIIFFVRDFWKR
ncbi:TrkH family potassium uptake protein [Treponema pectinovorum]|uniref:TrkH family potassium uptake protein n=1 Tax=Treponema pectinovorum TaxID=164 RepID=UPI003D90F03C